jgi:CDP-diacylglycerol pyrophosphatase
MRLIPATAALLLFGIGMIAARAADPDALWKIVHDRCVPDIQAHADPAPCAAVALDPGYAILKDLRGATQFLLIPTARITGIEGAEILAPGAPNYFQLAWTARGRVSERAGVALPDDDISLAINSMYGRSQNQLHIHIDCLQPEVHDVLAAHAGDIGDTWADFKPALAGAHYRARRMTEQDNPFALLAASLSVAPAEMGRHTLVVTKTPVGLVALDGLADAASGARGSGEDLQDHSCALAQRKTG